MVAGYQPGARLWSAAVHSTAQALASPHLRLLLTVLGTAHAAAAAATADVTADVDAAATLSPTAATAAASAPAPALDDDGGDELSRLLLHMLLEPAGAAGGGGGGGDGDGPLLFADGLAVACRFLPDAPLRSLLPRLLEQAVARGSLQGLCLCGMGEEALPLLQAAASSYVRSKEASSHVSAQVRKQGSRHTSCSCAACDTRRAAPCYPRTYLPAYSH